MEGLDRFGLVNVPVTVYSAAEEDLSELPKERSREIELVEFVPSDQLDPIMFDRRYFLEPDGSTTKAYVLLRRRGARSQRPLA